MVFQADAMPYKRFFIDLIIRDISLEDAVLDLLDNSIDSLVLTRNINLYEDLLNDSNHNQSNSLPTVNLEFNQECFVVEDNCGGITLDAAINEIFRFGRSESGTGPSLSVFGIGMKRAIFKMGREIFIESHHKNSGFSMQLNVDKWLDDETNWKFPISEEIAAKSKKTAGTKIVVSKLRPEVRELLITPNFTNRLIKVTKESYPFYLDKHVKFIINDESISSHDLTFGESEEIQPASDSWTDGNVDIEVICGLLPRSKESWTAERSGWYILCNGRVVLSADRSTLTGWGPLLPQFNPKHRGFIGVALFTSNIPEDLPWKTTKRGINTQSPVFIRTLNRMASLARPVTKFQDQLYASNDDKEPQQEYRESIASLKSKSATFTAALQHERKEVSQSINFKSPKPPPKPKLTSINFKVDKKELSMVKKSLGDDKMSNKEAGERIFKYYLDREC